MVDIVVILGAGASHDALRPELQAPPLARDLFDSQFDDIQRHFPGVDGLRDIILGRTSQGKPLETILGELQENRAEHIRSSVIEIPVYLKALLGQFTSDRPGTYDSLITLIQERNLSVMFVTLNYDTLLDEAITRRYNLSLPYSMDRLRSIGSYVSDTRVWSYIKLHGSVNWAYKDKISQEFFVVADDEQELSQEEAIHEYMVNLKMDDRYTRDGFEFGGEIEILPDNNTLSSPAGFHYPALAIPTDRKTEIVCPEPDVAALRKALRSDPAILVIGNQGLDSDLMTILAAHTDGDSSKPLHVVDKSQSLDVHQRFYSALNRPGMHPPPEPVDMSFKEFVELGTAERFLDQVSASSSETVGNGRRL